MRKTERLCEILEELDPRTLALLVKAGFGVVEIRRQSSRLYRGPGTVIPPEVGQEMEECGLGLSGTNTIVRPGVKGRKMWRKTQGRT